MDQELHDIIGEDLPILAKIKTYVMESGGKRVRPQLLLLFASHFGVYDANAVALAAITEIIHAASLLHDDVIDNAQDRRGKPAGRILFGNRQVILAGDYLLACGIWRLNRFENQRLMDVFTRVIKELAVAELLQMEYEQNPQITPEIYYRIIYGKTAILFEAATLSAGIYAGQVNLDALEKIGRDIGFLFQIRDDILDYFGAHLLNKTPFQDYENGLFTYPVIELLNRAEEKTRQELLHFMTLPWEKRKDKRVQREFLLFLERHQIKEISIYKIESLYQSILQELKNFQEDEYIRLIKAQLAKLCQLAI
ncbi:MAG: polyprenyl synthetase family protein [Leptospiraceae bacterium]|nr:polyprenyl synthetase family protein [Leptospiraceae bacterium]